LPAMLDLPSRTGLTAVVPPPIPWQRHSLRQHKCPRADCGRRFHPFLMRLHHRRARPPRWAIHACRWALQKRRFFRPAMPRMTRAGYLPAPVSGPSLQPARHSMQSAVPHRNFPPLPPLAVGAQPFLLRQRWNPSPPFVVTRRRKAQARVPQHHLDLHCQEPAPAKFAGRRQAIAAPEPPLNSGRRSDRPQYEVLPFAPLEVVPPHSQ